MQIWVPGRLPPNLKKNLPRPGIEPGTPNLKKKISWPRFEPSIRKKKKKKIWPEWDLNPQPWGPLPWLHLPDALTN